MSKTKAKDSEPNFLETCGVMGLVFLAAGFIAVAVCTCCDWSTALYNKLKEPYPKTKITVYDSNVTYDNGFDTEVITRKPFQQNVLTVPYFHPYALSEATE